jgi:hypothetical protein
MTLYVPYYYGGGVILIINEKGKNTLNVIRSGNNESSDVRAEAGC